MTAPAHRGMTARHTPKDPFTAGLLDLMPDLATRARNLSRGNPTRAEDLLQDTMTRALERRHLFDGTNLRGWLYTIMRNLSCDVARHDAQFVHHSADDDVISDAFHRRTAAPPAQEDAVMVAETLVFFGRLGPGRLAALTAVAFDEMTYEEASEALGINAGTLRSRISRGRRDLSEMCGVGS
ncbi:sigma-70 family RNA polymerase sigma factor [Azospirillum brasilense]|uniref:sigma-70 family RNA polymerase sigma factor n=1 Tax=Azospirillum brasilense TaxID=192 RepID=UPI00190AB986|nr:sigma-70 family RNA polymerase sigma factor [Azospirillum brasilense]